MGNQIETASYAAGFTVPPPLNTVKRHEDRSKKTLGTFKSILKSILADNTPAEDVNSVEYLMNLPQDEALVLLQDAVRSRGDVLRHRQNAETILAYKQSVANFITYITHKAYIVTNRVCTYRDRYAHYKRKQVINIVIINEKLDRFAADLMTDQKNQLYILERLEEIYGLLVDLIT